MGQEFVLDAIAANQPLLGFLLEHVGVEAIAFQGLVVHAGGVEGDRGDFADHARRAR